MDATSTRPPLAQIALSVLDLRRTEQWYVDGLGFLPAGGSIFMMSGPIAARVQGLPRAASCGWWLVGRNRWFQLELFQFRRPLATLMPADFRPCDIGYTRIGVHVTDFDRALLNLERLGSTPLAPVAGAPGRRRACLRDPDGIHVEIMEDDPLPQPAGSERGDCPVAVRYVTLSTPDLAASSAFIGALSGTGAVDIALHTGEHEALWGLPGARCERRLYRTGDVLIEIVQYADPPGKPWPADYRISDQGILNIAWGTRRRADMQAVYERALAAGARPNCRPLYFDGGGVVYLNDPLGFSAELTCVPDQAKDRKYGFEPLPRDARPLPDNRRIEATVHIDATPARVWEVLTDQDRMGEWCGFDEVRLTKPGPGSRHGIGSERRMRGPTGTIVEQVIDLDPPRRILYRAIDGAPFNFHRGEICLRPSGQGTEVRWSIGFRRRFPFTAALFAALLRPRLARMLEHGLKPHVERLNQHS